MPGDGNALCGSWRTDLGRFGYARYHARPAGPSKQERGLLQHFSSRSVRAALPVALALAFLLAPLAGGGGFFGLNGRVVYYEGANLKASDGSTLVPGANGPGASLSPDA